jgi:hypothetical protein
MEEKEQRRGKRWRLRTVYEEGRSPVRRPKLPPVLFRNLWGSATGILSCTGNVTRPRAPQEESDIWLQAGISVLYSILDFLLYFSYIKCFEFLINPSSRQ